MATFEEVIRLTATDATIVGVRAAEATISRLKQVASIPLRILDLATAPLRAVLGALQQVGFAAMGIQAMIGTVKNLVEPAVGFETAFTRIAALTTSSADDLATYRTRIEEVARLTGRRDEELANATFFIASAGQHGAAAMDVLEASAKASAAGLGDTKVVADAVTSSLNAYKLAGSQAAHVTDLLTNAVVQGKMEPAALAGSLGRILPIAAAVGVSLDQVLASMATMTRVGMDPENAATALRGVLAALESPGATAAATLDQIGYSADRLRNSIRERGLLVTLQDLMKRTHGNVDMLSDIIPNIRALTGVLATAGSQSEAYAEILGSMGQATGRTDKAFETMAKTAQHNFDVLGVAWEQFREAIGVSVIPAIIPIMQGFARWLEDNQDAFGAWAASFTAALPELNRIGAAIWHEVQPALRIMLSAGHDLWQFLMAQAIPALGDFWQWLSPKLRAAADAWSTEIWPMLQATWRNAWSYITTTLLPKLQEIYDWLYPKAEAAIGWWTGIAWPGLQATWAALSAFVEIEVVPKLVAIYDWIYPKIEEAINWAVNTGWPSLQRMWDGMKAPEALKSSADDLVRAKDALTAFGPALENLRATWANLEKLDANWLYFALAPVLPILIPLKTALDHMDSILGFIGGAAELATAAIRKLTDLLVWLKDQGPAIGGAFSALGTIIHGIADDIAGILANLPKLPGFGGAGPQLMPQTPPTLTTGTNSAAATAWAGGDTTRHALPVIPHLAGGWLTEPIIGTGLDSGRSYSFAEDRRPEYVSPAGGGALPRPGPVTLTMMVEKGAVQINAGGGPADAWADGADAFWIEVSKRLRASLSNRTLGVGRA